MLQVGNRGVLKNDPLADTTDLDEFQDNVRPLFGNLKFDLPQGTTGFHANAKFRRLNRTGVYYACGVTVTVHSIVLS